LKILRKRHKKEERSRRKGIKEVIKTTTTERADNEVVLSYGASGEEVPHF
jgi:hypothetical protein